MSRMLLLIATCALAALALAPATLAQQGESPTCEDFASQAEAQAALREDPSDPYGLDGPPGPVGTGEPGVACEGAIGGPTDFRPVANEGVVPGSEGDGGPDYAAATASASASPSPTPPPAEQPLATVAVSEDGQVTIDGDVGTDCVSFAISVEEGYTLGLTAGQRQDVLAECERLGFLPSEPASASPAAEPPPEEVGVSENGQVALGIDTGTDCRSFAAFVEEGYELGLTQEQIQDVLAECARLGFLASEDTSTASASASATPEPSTPEPGTPEESSAEPTPEPDTPEPEVAAAPGGVLPETGGPAMLLLPVAVLLVGAGVLGVTVSRRRRS